MAHRRLVPILAAVALVAASAACAVRSPSIGDLQNNPGRYYDKTVSVEGTVTSSWGIPLVPLKMYRVGDSTGEITVISESERVPPKGARVRVKGRVTEFGTFGGKAIGMHLRETSLRVLGSS
ncbi:MAG TPA: hypothetical protein VNK41_08775 [Vicinamibacterales bacterium]|nr:hypothetical protein [Vicinamibacterales bacterium]